MKVKQKEPVIREITTAVAASTLLFTILLMIAPSVFIILLVFSAFIGGMKYPAIVLPILFILTGLILLAPGALLNIAISHKLSRLYKLISILLYIILITTVTILLFPQLLQQMSNHKDLYQIGI